MRQAWTKISNAARYMAWDTHTAEAYKTFNPDHEYKTLGKYPPATVDMFRQFVHPNPFCTDKTIGIDGINHARMSCSHTARYSPRLLPHAATVVTNSYFLDWLLSGPHLMSNVESHGASYLSDLEQEVWNSRRDLHRAFPNVLNSETSYKRFKEWFEMRVEKLDEIPEDPALLHLWSQRNAFHKENPFAFNTRCCSNTTMLPGVNVIGWHTGVFGIAKSGTQLIHALRHNTTALQVNSILFYGAELHAHVRPESRGLSLTTSMSEPVNLFVSNAGDTPSVRYQFPAVVRNRKYNIGYWAWELDIFPDEWMKYLADFDEIWVPSSFIQSSIFANEKYGGTPVRVLPIPVLPDSPALSGKMQQSVPNDNHTESLQLPIPKDCFLFLVTFDFFSSMARKNPMGAIKAFMEAFPVVNNDPVCLVIKSINGKSSPVKKNRHAFQAISEFTKHDLRIVHITSHLSDSELRELQQRTDCYVSLHRSEGYGMNIAEALSQGKPVIATNYSGNADFFPVLRPHWGSCVFPIPFAMINVEDSQGVYSPKTSHQGQVNHWADPDHGAAMNAMRRVVEVGRAGCQSQRLDIAAATLSQLGLDAVGRQARQYLDEARSKIEGKVNRPW